MEENIVVEDIENIKNFTLNRVINSYKEFVDYFYGLLDDDKDTIIYYTILYKKHNDFVKNGNLDKIYNFYEILLHKLKYDKLNFKERYIYEHINSYLIISGDFKSNELFDKYVKENLSSLTRFNFKSRVFIILQDIVNRLNKEYNKDYSLMFFEQEPLACTNWFNKVCRGKILLSSKRYFEHYEIKRVDDIALAETFAMQAFIILHEYRHLLQRDYMVEHDDDLAKLYKFELFSVTFYDKLYTKNHNGFYIEKEANEFALNNFYKYIKSYFKNKTLNVSDLSERNFDTFCMNEKDKKSFIIKYKLLRQYVIFLNKINCKTKKLKKFDSKLNAK